MGQVLERRYLRQLADAAPLPDLVLIDGGKGQVNAAAGSLAALGLAEESDAKVAAISSNDWLDARQSK
ncbi:UvrABC system protein C [compost metagenome]